MVRINLINPRSLADQHLIAEYNEILMLLGHVRRHPQRTGIPSVFSLGPGHIKFFKDKLLYIQQRHERVKKEMKRRGFAINKTIDLSEFPVELHNDWKPSTQDKQLLRDRIAEKIILKPKYYRYEGVHKPKEFFLSLIKFKN